MTLTGRTPIRGLATAGGGLILGFHLPGTLAAASPFAKQDLSWNRAACPAPRNP